ncbi:MAG: bifunctional lysine ketoglutarate reductase /saccharopine dehydrogenase family protein [Calditrichia bacterium]
MKNCIGIRQENIDRTERRVPLTPEQTEHLIKAHRMRILVQPAPNRFFPEKDYRNAGAEIAEDLSPCNVIFGVKEIPEINILPGHAHCFFSHTIKGQAYNMPLLKHVLKSNATLIDYEKVTDYQDQRLIFFGRFAGYAGMIDSLWALGKRLKWEGISAPFSEVEYAGRYDSLKDAKRSISEVGKKIANTGLPDSLVPLIFGITGYGQVSLGAQEILDLLPHQEIAPKELAGFIKKKQYSKHQIYKVIFKEEDLVKPVSEKDSFQLQDYYQNPRKYKSCFGEFLPYLTVLVNGIYWEPKYPRLVTKEFMRYLYKQNSGQNVRVIGDITCDIEGSVEMTVKSTNSENPVFVYEPLSGQILDGWEGKGPVILAVDKLPAELPREASETFGAALMPFVPSLAQAEFDCDFINLSLPREIIGAVIAHRGELTPEFKYLTDYLNK